MTPDPQRDALYQAIAERDPGGRDRVKSQTMAASHHAAITAELADLRAREAALAEQLDSAGLTGEAAQVGEDLRSVRRAEHAAVCEALEEFRAEREAVAYLRANYYVWTDPDGPVQFRHKEWLGTITHPDWGDAIEVIQEYLRTKETLPAGGH